MSDQAFLDRLAERGAIVRFAKSGKLHTLDARPIAPSLSNSELARILEFVDVRHLELEGANVTDALAGSFEHLQRVQHLDLQRTQITDASLDVFRQLPKLQFLLLTGAPVSKAGIEALRKSLLGARIVFL